jgi:hypothetical protein
MFKHVKVHTFLLPHVGSPWSCAAPWSSRETHPRDSAETRPWPCEPSQLVLHS